MTVHRHELRLARVPDVRRWALPAILAAILVVPIAAAVLTQPAAPPAAATPRGAETLSLVVGGIPTPLGADQEIPVAGDLVARATVGRENGTTRRLELQLSGGDGRPREATVLVSGRMRYMDHGSFVAAAIPAEPGRYVTTLPFAMTGEWELRLDISGVAAPGRITLDLDVTR